MFPYCPQRKGRRALRRRPFLVTAGPESGSVIFPLNGALTWLTNRKGASFPNPPRAPRGRNQIAGDYLVPRFHRGRLMTLRALCLLAIGLGSASAASAGEGLVHRVSCTVVRYYVAKYSAPAAEAWARSKGATEAEIETARRCIPPQQTAHVVQAAQ
jgi:hypothetical protein